VAQGLRIGLAKSKKISKGKKVMPRTYSQKVARVFEIVDYLMLLPAGIGVFFGFFLISFNPALTLLLYAFVAVGIVLLVGYFKHSRGRLDEKYFSALWLTTAGYNLVLFLPALYWVSTLLQTGDFKDYDGKPDAGTVIFFLILLGVVFGYLSAIVSSLKAFSFERRKKYI
jgi:hypothetical protein